MTVAAQKVAIMVVRLEQDEISGRRHPRAPAKSGQRNTVRIKGRSDASSGLDFAQSDYPVAKLAHARHPLLWTSIDGRLLVDVNFRQVDLWGGQLGDCVHGSLRM